MNNLRLFHLKIKYLKHHIIFVSIKCPLLLIYVWAKFKIDWWKKILSVLNYINIRIKLYKYIQDGGRFLYNTDDCTYWQFTRINDIKIFVLTAYLIYIIASEAAHENMAMLFFSSKFSIFYFLLIQYLDIENSMGHCEYHLKHSGCNKRKCFTF